MKLITVSGPPSSGKTAVLLNVIKHIQNDGGHVGVVKFDCLTTDDDKSYALLDVPTRVGLSGGLCPDHYFVSNIENCAQWGQSLSLDFLFSESAGLCNRCSPHIRGVQAVCVIDNLMGLNTPRKIGPMLRFADIVVITKGDIVSQAEREVFAYQVRQANPRAIIMQVNGITGQGALELAMLFRQAQDTLALHDERMRFSLPSAHCSYCLGETRIGETHQLGNIKKMKV